MSEKPVQNPSPDLRRIQTELRESGQRFNNIKRVSEVLLLREVLRNPSDIETALRFAYEQAQTYSFKKSADEEETLIEKERRQDNLRGKAETSLLRLRNIYNSPGDIDFQDDPDRAKTLCLGKEPQGSYSTIANDSNEKILTTTAEETKRHFENVAVLYLLKKIEATTPGFEIRNQQIDAIIALLQKDHLQAATGFGKSKTVIPIATAVYALANNANVALATVSPELRDELKKNVDGVAALLPEWARVTIVKHDRPEDKTPQLFNESIGDIITAKVDPTPTQEVLQKRVEGFFDQSLSTLGRDHLNTPSITIYQENDLVFHVAKSNELIYDHVFFDEIHVPFTRDTVYYTSSPTEFPTREMVEDFVLKRFLAGVIKEALVTENLLVEKEGSYDLVNEDAEDRIYNLAYCMQNRLTGYRTGDYRIKVIDLMAKEFGLSTIELDSWLNDRLRGINENGLKDTTSELLLSLVAARKLRSGVEYQTGGVPRDHIMGLALASHKFSSNLALGIQTWEDDVQYVDYFQSAGITTSFEGWVVNHLKGKISGVSGSLFTPTLLDVTESKKTVLAEFLEKATRHDAVKVGEERMVPPPTPQLLSDESLAATLLKTLKRDERLVIIGCFDENEAGAVRAFIASQLPKRKIFMADASIDEEEAKKRYEAFAAEEGKAILISTGRVGVGVDLKTPTGQFTDHRTIIYGIPYATNQVYQLMGRRRMASENPAADFSWLFSYSQLDFYPTYLSQAENVRKSTIREIEKNPLRGLDKLITTSEGISQEVVGKKAAYDQTYDANLNELKKTAQSLTTEYLDTARTALGFSETVLVENALIRVTQQSIDQRLLTEFVFGLYGSLADYFVSLASAPDDLYYHMKGLLDTMQEESGMSALANLNLLLRSDMRNKKTVREWLDNQESSFVYTLQGYLGFLRSSGLYETLKSAKTRRFAAVAFYPHDEPAIKFSIQGFSLKPAGGNYYVGIKEGQSNYYVFYLDNGVMRVCTNVRDGIPISFKPEEKLDFMFQSEKSGGIIAAIYS